MKEIEEYIIEFLLYGNKEAVKRVRLAAPVDWTLRYPDLGEMAKGEEAIKQNDNEAIRQDGETAIVSPDVIYNTFFFISRAEELLNPQRDEHGRFTARYSLLGKTDPSGKTDLLAQPLVDIYSRQLMQTLQLPLPPQEYATICLTHDIDTLDCYHHLRGALGGILRGKGKTVLASLRNIHNDPAYTFPWLEQTDNQCLHTKTTNRGQTPIGSFEIIYFVKHTLGKGYDYPQYPLRRVPKLKAKMGLHSSYYGTLPNPLPYTLHRSHFLRCSIHQMQQLADAGVTDDYTMGFADKAGFRLQTCRPVRWINPTTMQLTKLVLHPLTIMDCSLSNAEYMHLNEDEALNQCLRLCQEVKKYHGELVLLWHNSIIPEGYHRDLYARLLQQL